MQRTTGDWYLVLIVAAITALAVGAVFYISVWTSADPEWFKSLAFTGFGALLALLTQKVVADPNPPAE
jgi:L-asparagine transporter-like permease